MSQKTHLPVTQAGLVSLLGAIVGTIVALVPAWKPDSQIMIQAGTYLISFGFLIANAIHHRAFASTISVHDVEMNAVRLAEEKLQSVDLNSLVKDAVEAKSLPDLEAKITAAARAEVTRLLGQVASTPTA
jgi:hypothetical protein